MNPQWLIFPSVEAAEFTFVLSQAKNQAVDAIGLWIAVADKPAGRKTLMSEGQLVTRSRFTHAKHQLLEVREQLEMAEQELERKFSQTGAYQNMKKMLAQKNNQIKDLRRTLAK